MNYTEEEKFIIWLDSFVDLDYKTKTKLLKVANNPKDIFFRLPSFYEIIKEGAGEEEYNLMLRCANEKYLNYIFEALSKRRLTMLTFNSADYPEIYKEIPTPPIVLYCKGNLELLKSENILAIVGSRRTLPAMLTKCKEFSRTFAENGWTVVTGIAQGADLSAIEGALDSGNIISVIASGIDDIYPEQNRPVLDKVAENGLVIGEHNPGIKSKPFLFPIRNRLIAGLARGVLVVSGGKRSGTNYTAAYAGEFGRDLFAFPYSLGVESGEGCNELIKNGAMLVTEPKDIFECYGMAANADNANEKESEENEQEKAVLNILRQGDTHIEALADKTGIGVVELMPVLLMLEIKGKVIKNAGNIYTAV